MSAADYYNTNPRYRPSVVPQYPPPQYEPQPRPSRRPDHGLSRMEAHEDSPIEEIPRKFPPGEYADGHHPKRRSRRHRDYDPTVPPPRRARSAHGRYDDGYRHDDRRSHRSDPRRSDRHRPPKYDEPRRDRRSRRSPSSSPSSSPPPRRKPKRRKSLTQQAMGAMGALGIGNALTGEKDAHPRRHRSDSRGAGRRRRNRSSSSSSSRSRSRDGRVSGGHGHGLDQQQIAQAVKAALTAGATEAYRARKEPGGWTGAKGKRIITAAIASGGADSAMDSNPNKHGKRHVIESALAGLATNHALNGPRSRGGSRDGRGHSSKGGAVKGIATSGALLAAGKEIYDHLQSSRSKSRGRDRSSSSSSDGRDPRDRRRGGEKKKRSKSLSDYVSQGLAAVGLHDDVDDKHHEKPRRHGRGERERSSRHDGPYDSDSEPYDSEAGFRPKRRGYGGSDGNPRDVGRELPGSQNPNTALSKYERRGAVAPYHPPHTPQKDNDNDSDSDLGSSSDEENTRKKMARRQVLKTGMATVASVHAAHTVVGSMKKRKKRLTAIQKGEIDPEVAHNQRWKNYAMDAASVGLAAMSVHGAVGEWKDAKSKREACQKFKEDAEHRATKRQGKRSKSFG